MTHYAIAIYKRKRKAKGFIMRKEPLWNVHLLSVFRFFMQENKTAERKRYINTRNTPLMLLIIEEKNKPILSDIRSSLRQRYLISISYTCLWGKHHKRKKEKSKDSSFPLPSIFVSPHTRVTYTQYWRNDTEKQEKGYTKRINKGKKNE